MNSGMHHPDGIFWIRAPERRHEVHAEKISLRQVAPTVLALLDCPKPASMEMPAVSALQRTPAGV